MINAYDNGRDAMRAALAMIVAIKGRGQVAVPPGVVLAAQIALEVERKQADAREETDAQWVASIDRGSQAFLHGLFDKIQRKGEQG